MTSKIALILSLFLGLASAMELGDLSLFKAEGPDILNFKVHVERATK